MILVDYSQIFHSTAYATARTPEITPDLIPHIVFNTIRNIKMKFSSEEYGEIVICCDSKKNWRKSVYEYYKANRQKSREDSGMDWNYLFSVSDSIKLALKEKSPYKVIEVETAEGDDIIGTLSTTFGKHIIVSNDKDFGQLLGPNVKQYAPLTSEFIKIDNPKAFLIEHIIKGDSSDGIPNILSSDNVFIIKERQKSITAKFLASIESIEQLENWCKTNNLEANFKRNQKLIDLSCIPADISLSIMEEYGKPAKGNRTTLMEYFMANGMVKLLEDLQNF